jgi:hypothetical protein
METRPLSPSPWRVITGDALTVLTGLFALAFWFGYLISVGEPDSEWFVIPAAVLTLLSIPAYRRAHRRIERLLRVGVTMDALVQANVPDATPNNMGILTVAYDYGGVHYVKKVPYTPGKWQGLLKRIAAVMRTEPPRDDSAWIVGLKAGDVVQLLLDPAMPNRFVLARLYSVDNRTNRQRIGIALAVAAVIVFGAFQLYIQSNQ